MNKIITIGGSALLFIGLFFFLGSQTACQKQNTNCTCVITVDSGTGINTTPISGATVRLYAPHGTVGAIGVTNAAGDVTFTFALPAIFNIAATKPTLIRGDTLKINGYPPIIQLQIGQTESTTVTVTK